MTMTNIIIVIINALSNNKFKKGKKEKLETDENRRDNS